MACCQKGDFACNQPQPQQVFFSGEVSQHPSTHSITLSKKKTQCVPSPSAKATRGQGTSPIRTSQLYSYITAALQNPALALVLPSRRLTCLELIQIPPADAQAPLVLIHAPAEAAHVLRAGAALRLLARRVDLVRVLELRAGGGGLGGRAAAAREPAADGVADRGADCHSAACVLALERGFRGLVVW